MNRKVLVSDQVEGKIYHASLSRWSDTPPPSVSLYVNLSSHPSLAMAVEELVLGSFVGIRKRNGMAERGEDLRHFDGRWNQKQRIYSYSLRRAGSGYP